MYAIYLLIACAIGFAIFEVFVGNGGIKSFFIGALGGLGFGVINNNFCIFTY